MTQAATRRVPPAMRRFIGGTWLPTVLFVATIATIAGWGLARGWLLFVPALAVPMAMPLLVVPPIWWKLVASRPDEGSGLVGLGVVAGSLSTAAIVLVPMIYLLVVEVASPGHGGPGSIGNMGVFLLLSIGFIAAIPLGAALGVVAVVLQRKRTK